MNNTETIPTTTVPSISPGNLSVEDQARQALEAILENMKAFDNMLLFSENTEETERLIGIFEEFTKKASLQRARTTLQMMEKMQAMVDEEKNKPSKRRFGFF
jgi:hypothetical protein